MLNFGAKMTYSAWAIEERSRGPLCDGPHLMGRYRLSYIYSIDPATAKLAVPEYLEGHRTAAFRTRELARRALPKRWDVNGNFHWYVPVKVRVTISRD
jgi:hypothetical protein